ncbi:hypothetical protein E8E12_006531 [Didymella heteroderae]|uniref:Sequence-specific DNA binding RNA polymerase II transcription factor n=1 Tax=Didymella heteroderae TaxID=1769908 RepID=A0A9P4WMJ2_9PLEO|nr:hypothetical protein E8E12_006531 [Didymella heteroderae]
MDGGRQQQLMAEDLKKEIKRNALVRRAKTRMRITRRSRVDVDETEDPDPGLRLSSPGRDADRTTVHELITPAATPPNPTQTTFSGRQTNSGRPNQDVGVGPSPEGISAEQNDFERGLLMSYLDYAFPVLFPFYKPSILEGGRAWLLTLAMRYPAFYHNVIGLAACFYCAVPILPGLEHDACVVKAQTELHSQMEKAVRGVQDSLKDVTQKGVDYSLAENVRLLGNIVQLVNFEVVFASSENWHMHLDAAVELFLQTIKHHGEGYRDVPLMRMMLEKLRGDVPSNCSIWSSEQAALRFFTAMVVYQDILASTARERASTLIGHYDGILSPTSDTNQTTLLDLEDFIGCQNWILRSIAEITALTEWKRTAKQTGFLDIMDLVRRGTPIQDNLRSGTARLQQSASSPRSQPPVSPYQPLETILARSYINNGLTASQLVDRSVVSRIWAHAAQVYLITVLSGWQPLNIQLRSHVAQALDLLSTIDNPSWLRTLAWPFCVTGCFATKEQETAFRNVANASGGLAMFGTVRDALAITEKVWSLRDHFDADAWDIAFCLRILGHSVLLV